MNSKRGCRPDQCVRPGINLTPLIDVLLVLLIIFMVIAPHQPARFEVKAPAKPIVDGPPPPETLVLTLFPDSHFELNSRAIAMEDVVTVLSDLMARRDPTERQLFIRAPVDANYQSVVCVIDLAKGIGVKTIGLLAY
ncbi:MAG TPA: biopolymer transporter ExbD [Blastocatellia bacterium]|nr:biopolymer transporter ExbD [Blastocatellia bacterium]